VQIQPGATEKPKNWKNCPCFLPGLTQTKLINRFVSFSSLGDGDGDGAGGGAFIVFLFFLLFDFYTFEQQAERKKHEGMQSIR